MMLEWSPQHLRNESAITGSALIVNMINFKDGGKPMECNATVAKAV